MSEKLCKNCGAQLEDETMEYCENCAPIEEENPEVPAAEEIQPETEEVQEINEEQNYIDYEVVEEPVEQQDSSFVLKILCTVFGVLGGGYIAYYVIDLIKGFGEYLQQFVDMGMEIPASYLAIQYIYFGIIAVMAVIAIVGVVLVFPKKTALASTILFAFSACWGIYNGLPQMFSEILDEQTAFALKNASVFMTLSGVLLLAASIIAAVIVCKNYKTAAVSAAYEEVVIDPLAFDDGEYEFVENEEETSEDEAEEVIEVTNEED